MKKTTYPPFLLALAISLSSCGPSPEQLLADSQELYATHNYPAARLTLASALKERPEDPQLLELMARIQLAMGNGEGAENALASLAAANALPADGQELLAEAALLREQYDRVLEITASSDSAEARRLAAMALIATEKFEDAAAEFENGLAASGSKARLKSDFALFALAGGDIDRAGELARAALAEDPELLDSMLAVGRVTAANGSFEDALRHYTDALSAYPSSKAALLGKASALGDLGRLDEMRALVNQAAKDNPNDPALAYLDAWIAGDESDWVRARSVLQPRENEFRYRTEPTLLYAEALLETGQHEQARAQLAPLVRGSAVSAQATRLLTRIQLEAGEAKEAVNTIGRLALSSAAIAEDVALLSKAEKQAGTSGPASKLTAARENVARLAAQGLALGDRAVRDENWSQAAIIYTALLERGADENTIVLNNLAYAHSRLGNVGLAIEFGEKAVSVSPDNPLVLDTLGWILVESGEDRERGVGMLNRAANADPGNATIAAHLQQAKAR